MLAKLLCRKKSGPTLNGPWFTCFCLLYSNSKRNIFRRYCRYLLNSFRLQTTLPLYRNPFRTRWRLIRGTLKWFRKWGSWSGSYSLNDKWPQGSVRSKSMWANLCFWKQRKQVRYQMPPSTSKHIVDHNLVCGILLHMCSS